MPIDTNEPAICHEYWSEDSMVQQLSLKHLNVNVRYNNNAPAPLNDCIEGLLHLGTAITFRPSAFSLVMATKEKKVELFDLCKKAAAMKQIRQC